MNSDNPALINGTPPRLVNVSWNLDKYPNEPEFDARVKLTVLDADGPAMITNIHASAYYQKGSFCDGETALGSALWINVFYDYSDVPAISMPLMDFLGDIDGKCKQYSTIYFSKVREAHNFHLTMPFKKHIKIEIENQSDINLFGYMTFQVEPIEQWDNKIGYLYTQYLDETATIPDDVLEVMNVHGNGVLIAHWMQIKTSNPLAFDGSYICEGNNEFYLDGAIKPNLEYRGTEDLYGFAWGFNGEQSDGRCAIIRQDKENEGINLCMLRTRREDKIRFYSSCRLLINYTEEFFSSLAKNPRHKDNKKEQFFISYKTCCYYYKL